MRFARALLLAVVLFPVGLATHEVMHLAVYSALGVPAVLVVTSWKLGAAAVPIWGLHAAPAGAGVTVPLRTLLVNNALGPTLAALPLLALLASIPRRSRAARTALLANALALLFFAAIELAYPLLEEVAHVDADVLLLPELNYGAVLLILVGTAALATPAGGGRRRRRERATSAGAPAEAS